MRITIISSSSFIFHSFPWTLFQRVVSFFLFLSFYSHSFFLCFSRLFHLKTTYQPISNLYAQKIPFFAFILLLTFHSLVSLVSILQFYSKPIFLRIRPWSSSIITTITLLKVNNPQSSLLEVFPIRLQMVWYAQLGCYGLETFLQYFSNFGYVKKATIMKSADQTSRGFGFVTFEDPYVASYVVCMKDHMIDGRRVFDSTFSKFLCNS